MTTEARAALSREAIVTAAVELADREGLDALSMRRLADAVGFGTMSLYNHVRDKDDVLHAMLEAVVTQIELPAPGEAEGVRWKRALRSIAHSQREALGRHPWACQLWQTAWPGPARKALMEGLLRCLREGGFSPRMAHHGFHAFDLYVVGHAQQAAQFAASLDGRWEQTITRFFEETPADEYPYVIEHVEQHGGDGSDDDFAFMLELLLDGLERHRPA